MDFEFESNELEKFKRDIRNQSLDLINKLVKKHSPIKIGETVNTWPSWSTENEAEKLIVTEIILMAVDSWGYPGDKLSFEYEGAPLKKNGEKMKNRKPIWFNCFKKNAKRYHMPTYNRVEVTTARL